MSTTFSARLNRLFDTVYPPGRGPHTSAEVVVALKAEGITTMSAPYLSQLRSGERTNPSKATMNALANFFRIQPDYFTDEYYYRKLDQELTWLATLRDEDALRIAMRTIRLSAAALEEIIQLADEWRRKEHLDN
jgi:transcriptional regulator with XRE-family HTH domain